MDRLFVFGDSWAFNYFAKEINPYRPEQRPGFGKKDVIDFVNSFNNFGHWTDYMAQFYEVINYAEGGISIDDIIHQFGYLNEFKDGDRMLIIFPNPERLQWFYNNYRGIANANAPWLNDIPKTDRKLLLEQLVARHEAWYEQGLRNNEIRLLNKLPLFFKKYNPVLLSWDSELVATTTSLTLIPVHSSTNYKTIWDESGGKYVDDHMGIRGNWEVFKFIGNELEIDTSKIKFNNPYDKSII